MGMREEIERRDIAERSRHWRYQWWGQADAVPMLESLLQKLKEAGDGSRLLLHRAMREDGAEVVWLEVALSYADYFRQSEAETGEQPEGSVGIESHDGAFNMSHPCPPFCT